MIDFNAVGDKIASLRKGLGWTQDALAEKLFVSRQNVSKWEKGIGVPTIETVIALSELFSVPVEEILCLDLQIEVDATDIFAGHNRFFILNAIAEGKIKVNLPDVLSQMQPMERMYVLGALCDGRIQTDAEVLFPCLTAAEQTYLRKGLRK